MWVDSGGVAHTISVPDPTIIIGRQAFDIIRGLKRARRADLESLLEEIENEVYDEIAAGRELRDVRLTIPPSPVLSDSLNTVDDLVEQLRLVPLEWRLDAISTCQEVIGE